METWQQASPIPSGQTEEQSSADWSAQNCTGATPYCGTLGPGSGLAMASRSSTRQEVLHRGPLAAVVIVAVLVSVLIGHASTARAAWEHLGDLLGTAQPSTRDGVLDLASTKSIAQLNGLQARKQAETLLELAIGDSGAANQEIAQRVNGWRGKLSLDSQLGTLTTAALNSNDLQVRQSGIEVQLAAYGLAKNSSTVAFLIQNAASSGHAQKVWALWALGALANRGVESARAEQVLVSHLKDADEDSRAWAVESLSLAGTTTTIAPLLEVMHDDPSPAVRERAASSLAETGMLSHEQRLAAVPQLVNYTEDASLDSQTHAWAFQALEDITKVRLPNDPGAWRNWYASANGKE